MKKPNPFLQGNLPEPAIPIKQKILGSIDNRAFFAEIFGEGFEFNRNYSCPFPGHIDETPSFRAKEDGSFKCYGCDRGGSNLVQFYMYLNGLPFEAAIPGLYKKWCNNFAALAPQRIVPLKKDLKRNGEVLRFLEVSRGWSTALLDYLDIGLFVNKNDTKYVSIPIKDPYGFVSTICYYNLFNNNKDSKFYFEKLGENSPNIFGLECVNESKTIYIFEGIPDCLLALSLGYPAITFGSANSWKDSWRHYLKDLDLIICYDNDEAGYRGRDYIAGQATLVANSVKTVNTPSGNDFTEYMIGVNFNRDYFDDLVNDVGYFKLQDIAPPTKEEAQQESKLTTLGKASLAENYNRPLRVVALIGGKEPSPMLIPRNVMMTCRDLPAKGKCSVCALAESPALAREFEVDEYFADILRWVTTPSKDQSRTQRNSFGVNVRCKVDVKPKRMWNVEKCILNSPVRFGKMEEIPERRVAFYLGSGLIPNKHYTLDLYTVSHPLDNTAVHIITSAEPLDTELETFRISDEINISLRSFQVGAQRQIQEKLDEIYNIFSCNITRIWGRDLLHLALDLPFFSPNEFIFDDEFVRRASLDILVFGDQRCGKGRIAEGLANYYRFAEILSGENLSFMNLVGGIESHDNYRGLRWGRLVSNNRGVVIIDEASAIETSVISKLSRIRSEALAELDKFGIHAKAVAGCSIIWISNPRNDPLSRYNFGVEALRELVGQPEDIARFDYAIAVRANEVSAKLINRSVEKVTDLYGSNLHRTLLLWCKTRTKEQIHFDRKAIVLTHRYATGLGKKYSSTIPLLQTENARIKLAKIAAAIAGRTYSCDLTGDKLIVTSKHIKFAAQFLRQIYDSQTLGYHDFSRMDMLTNEVSEKKMEDLLEPLRELGTYSAFIKGMLTLKNITIQDCHDLSGLNFYDAKDLCANLSRIGAFAKDRNYYMKSRAFISYLKEEFHRLSNHSIFQ